MPNTMGRTRKVNDPYEIYIVGTWEWRVLKHYQSPEKEAVNRYARCFCAVKSEYTYDGYDMGDVYIADYAKYAEKLTDDEMVAHLAENKWKEW